MPSLTLQEAAARLGVHYMTMYRYVRLGLIEAEKRAGTWQVSEEALEALHHPPISSQDSDTPWSARLESRLVAGDVTGAWSLIEAALASGKEPAEIYVDVLAPALRHIGDRWATGDLDVDDEHIATAVAHRLVGRLSARFTRRGRDRGSIVAAMPPGERHGLGLTMLTDVLRGAGYHVLDLGPDTPIGSLVKAIARTDNLKAVCIGVVMQERVAAATEMIAAVRKVVGPEVLILVGGAAIPDVEMAQSIGANGYAADPMVAVGLIEAGAIPSD